MISTPPLANFALLLGLSFFGPGIRRFLLTRQDQTPRRHTHVSHAVRRPPSSGSPNRSVVLNLVQGSAAAVPNAAIAPAILIAASSNNLLKSRLCRDVFRRPARRAERNRVDNPRSRGASHRFYAGSAWLKAVGREQQKPDFLWSVSQ